MARSTDRWSDWGSYETYVGRWSRRVAEGFLRWLDVVPNARWLDVGCGTGALSESILALAEPASVQGVDPSADDVAHARARGHDARAGFGIGDAMTLPFGAGTFDVAASGLVLNFVPEPAVAVREMARVTRPGATVAAYVWDYAGEMQLLRHFWNAAAALDPAAAELDEGVRFSMCRPRPLLQLFEAAGLRDVEARAIDVPTPFRDFDDYWTPFLGGQGPAPGYAMSLTDEGRARLRGRIAASLPTGPNGSVDLMARAWAVRGTR